MNGKFLFYICAILLAAGVVVFHFRRANSGPAMPLQKATTRLLRAVSSELISVPPETVSNQAGQDSGTTNQATPQIVETQTNRDDNTSDLGVQLEKRAELMNHLRDWAAKDLDGALTWALQLTNSDERNEALEAVCFGLARKDPAHAVEMAQTLQQPESVMEGLVQQWAARDIVPALVWVNDQAVGDQHDQLMQRVAFDLSQTDPTDAAGLVMEQIPPGPVQDEAVMTVLHQWGNQNLQAAASWVQTFPNGQLQERATEELEGIARYQKELARQ
jgi:hypothetical protein